MDKREQKTITKVYAAFTSLVKSKDYANISVQDIIDEANISRSTFYAHFKTKDDVLVDVCSSIFDHVFSAHLSKEKNHDFSTSDIFEYDHFITHILYHLYDDKNLVQGVLNTTGNARFYEVFKEKSYPLMEKLVISKTLYKEGVPERLQIHQLQESFLSLITDWVLSGCKETPERISEYFFVLHK